jgi:L-asparaginase
MKIIYCQNLLVVSVKLVQFTLFSLLHTMKNTILFLLTGGTIDSFYDGTKDTVIPHEDSILPQYIKNLKLYDQTNFFQICMKDSREINTEDRENILQMIEKTSSHQIIITHGTYTMPDTAKYLKANLQRSDQSIIVTGAMIPNEMIHSDGPFNLGYSLAQVKQLPPGVYICMNGKTFTADEAAKDIAQGRFVSLFSQDS